MPTVSSPVTNAQWRNQWSIAVYTGSALDGLAPAAPRPVLTGSAATDVRGGAAADPFLVPDAAGYRLFFEIWNVDRGAGEIATAVSADGIAWTYESVVLREPFHLSYPQVIALDDAHYMIPETRQDEAVHLYRAEAYPAGWRRVATLLRGAYADATIARIDGRWWMFAQRGLDELRLFTSARLDAGWQEHPASPLWTGNRSRTRPGGRILEDGGRRLRFAQDGWPTYGHSLRAFEIQTLTPTAYAEREIAGSPILRASRSGWNAVAMHHIDALRRPDGTWLAVVDGAAPGFF